MNDPSQVILYLAECIAATAHDFDKRSAPKGERIRHRKLCETVADILAGKATVAKPLRHVEYDKHKTIARLCDMAALLRSYEEPDERIGVGQ